MPRLMYILSRVICLLLLANGVCYAQEDSRGSRAKALKTEEKAGVTRALVIGIGKSGERDANLFCTYLQKAEQLPEEQLFCLTGKNATAVAIYTRAKELVDSVEANDIIYVYFSGISYPNTYFDDRESLFLTSDASLEHIQLGAPGLIRLSDLVKLFGKATEKAAQVRYVFDSNKIDTPNLTEAQALHNLENLQTLTQGTQTFLATTGNQFSQTNASGDYGIYTRFWVTGLLGAADLNADNEITYSEFDDYLYENTQAASNSKQSPLSPSQPGAILKKLQPGVREKALELSNKPEAFLLKFLKEL